MVAKLFKVEISLPREIDFTVEAENEDEARSKAEDAILRAMEKGGFKIEVKEAEQKITR